MLPIVRKKSYTKNAILKRKTINNSIMKKKLEITGLKVESFVTDMERPNTKDIKGGGPDTKGDQCQRTSYLGYTYCSCI